MNLLRRVMGAFRREQFDSAPRPIDVLFREMYRTGAAARVSRAEALSVPAVQQGRRLICAISTLPLVQYGPGNLVVRNPLLEQIDPNVANVVTLAQTVDDLLFEAIAWWRITAFGFDGYPVTAERVDPARVSTTPPGNAPRALPSGFHPEHGVVYIDGRPVSGREVIRFDSPNPPLLSAGARAIRRALLLDAAASMYADNPRPLDYFTAADGADPMDDDDIREMLANWDASRKNRSTAYIPAALTYNTVSQPTPQELQLVELTRQTSLEIANSIGVNPDELGVPVASQTYSNVQDRRKDKINDTLAPYMRAITDRLSMADVTKRGYVVRFDLGDFMKANETERANVYKTYVDMGAMTVEEVREKEGLPPLPAGVAQPTDDGAETPVTEEVDAAKPPALTFDRPAIVTFDVEVTGFSVDSATRTIEGLAVPYGRIAGKGGLKYKFAKDSLQWGDPSRVKLLRDHDFGQPLGKAVALKSTPAGLQVRFQIARGPEGDRALELAEDGVLDGLSVGVDFDMSADTELDARDKTVTLVRRADLREVSLTAMPAFDDARVTKVAASRDGEETGMDPEETQEAPPVAGGTVTLTAEQFNALINRPEPEVRPVVNPVRDGGAVFVNEPVPYRFDRAGNFVPGQEHVFSADLHAMALANDAYGDRTEAGRRVMGLLSQTFDVDSTDINEATPAIQRPDLYVDQREYRTPLWNFVNRGAPPNGIQPFTFPKFNAASGLVGDHTEGTEPTGGTMTTTGQTITPTPLSGKAYLTREVWDMGGNPAVSTLIWNQMVRGYREGLESATATFLNTLTAATDINLGAGVVDAALAAAWDVALARLQFARGYNFEAFALEQELFVAFVDAVDGNDRKIYSQINPQNANGTAARRFVTLDLGGVTGVPAWGLASTAGSPNNSWLFDPSVVWGFATAPQRLEFPGGSDDNTTYQPVAKVGIGIWGYKAFANTDIGGVRQVIYDTTA